ncbi:MAG TPA: hypothetical protein VGO68_20365 [Pyrinomonadaceae bacterium]|jgi:hypothetical protein|nr:hypothetical protein [Pyrinomonadaceae bacterium]
METVAGIFASRAAAEDAVKEIHSLGIPTDRIALLTPGMSDKRVEAAVPTDDTEQPGMGAAMGGTVGGAIGVAGGASLGAAVASLLVPGVGPVIAGGILGAALLGAGGTLTGVAAGQALEKELEAGLPHDELFLYEDALRKGHSVVVAFVEEEGAIYAVRGAFAGAGAEGIDEARENWWIGLRDAEEAQYEATDRTFQADESSYRRGFEDALKTRGKDSEARHEFIASHVEADNEAYRRGFERGLSHHQALREKYKA